MNRKLWLSVAALAAVLIAAGLYWFQPWKLFTTKTVNDVAPVIVATGPTPSSAAPSPSATTAVLVASGTFVTHEHDTSGKVQIVHLADGRNQLVISELSTSDGPDLRVWLTDQPLKAGDWHNLDDGKWVEVGPLKGTHGTLVYDIDPGVNPADYHSVTIWCKRFSVSFGAAALA